MSDKAPNLREYDRLAHEVAELAASRRTYLPGSSFFTVADSRRLNEKLGAAIDAYEEAKRQFSNQLESTTREDKS